LKETLRQALRVALSSYATNGLVTALGLLVISALVHVLLGPAASAAATVGVIVVTPPDRPAPRRGKFSQLLPAVVLGVPLFLGVQALHHAPLPLWLLLVGSTFLAFLGAAWGKRGLPISIAVMLAMVFAFAAPPPASFDDALQQTLYFVIGAGLYLLWGPLANSLLNSRYRVLTLVDSLFAVASLMRTQALAFTLPAGPQGQPPDVLGRLMKEQAALADQLQTARNLLLESPRTDRRLQLAGMLVQVLDMRDHLVACGLDLEALRSLPQQQHLVHALGIEIQALAGDIEALADAMLLARQPRPFTRQRPALAAVAAAEIPTTSAVEQMPTADVLGIALARRVGYLHDETGRLVALARGEQEPDLEVVRTVWQLFVSPTAWTLRPFLSLWSWDAPPLRHAIRAALAIGVGQALGNLLPWGTHEYWILLTIVVVLRGSLAQTLERRNSRVAGTILGSLLAAALLYVHPSAAVLLLAVTLGQGIAHAFAVKRYLVTAVAATVLALVQAHLLYAEASTVFDVAERVGDTLLGVLIAWVFSYVLPSWERTQVPALVRRALKAQARHAQLALALGQPRAVDTQAELGWRLARREAYDSLSALVQAIQRSLSEPRAVRPRLDELERMLAHAYQLLAQLTAIKTMLLQRRDRLDFPALQGPLQLAAATIAAELDRPTPAAAQDASPAAAREEARPMLELPDAVEGNLNPWLLRRLHLAVRIGQDLGVEAARAVAPAPQPTPA
jgi:uncharacterized membrane protein YccC